MSNLPTASNFLLIPSILKTYLSGSIGCIQPWRTFFDNDQFLSDVAAHGLITPIHLALSKGVIPPNFPQQLLQPLQSAAITEINQRKNYLETLHSILAPFNSKILYKVELFSERDINNVLIWFEERHRDSVTAIFEDSMEHCWSEEEGKLMWFHHWNEFRVPVHTIFLDSDVDFQMKTFESYIHFITRMLIERRLDRLKELYLLAENLWKSGGLMRWDIFIDRYRSSTERQAVYCNFTLGRILFGAPVPIDTFTILKPSALENYLIQRWLPSAAAQGNWKRQGQNQRLMEILLNGGNIASFASHHVKSQLKKMIHLFR